MYKRQAVLYTRTTVALALPQAPSHTKRSSPFQGPTAACACPMSPPQGCPIPILGRSVITYFRYADTYAGRPRLSSLVSRHVRMPTTLSAVVSNVPYNPPNHTISKAYPDSCSRITSSGPPRILLTPISGLAPAGAAPANKNGAQCSRQSRSRPACAPTSVGQQPGPMPRCSAVRMPLQHRPADPPASPPRRRRPRRLGAPGRIQKIQKNSKKNCTV